MAHPLDGIPSVRLRSRPWVSIPIGAGRARQIPEVGATGGRDGPSRHLGHPPSLQRSFRVPIMLVITDQTHVQPENRLRVLDYSGACEKPYAMPLQARALWATARRIDLYGEVPLGAASLEDWTRDPDLPSGEALAVDVQYERTLVRCGKCAACTWRRRKRWETAAIGWSRTSDLSIFGTLTFSNQWFSERYNKLREDQFEEGASTLERQPGFDIVDYETRFFLDGPATEFVASEPDHVSAARRFLVEERQKFLKRFRWHLSKRKEFEGVQLVAHLELMEVGDLRGRPHFHFLFHFVTGSTDPYLQLRDLIKDQWHADGEGIGFVDCKRVETDYGDAGAAYVCKYIGKYIGDGDDKRYVGSETRIACSLAYIAKGRGLYGDTAPTGEVSLEESESGHDATKDAELDQLLDTGGFKGIPDSDIPYWSQVMAHKVALAREAFNVGELWPGHDHGAPFQETDWRYYPPHESDFAGWVEMNYTPGGPHRWFNPEYVLFEEEESSDEGADITPEDVQDSGKAGGT